MTTSSLCGKPDDDESRKSWTNKDWYTHVGAWENEQGQLCFGSTIAFSAMLQQFHRVWTAAPQPPASFIACHVDESCGEAPQPPVGEDVEWSYCPECGSDEIHQAEGQHKQCANCHQEWFSDIDYSDTVRHHLGGHYGNWKSLITARDHQITALQARIAELEKALRHVDKELSGDTPEDIDHAMVVAALAQQVTKHD